MSYRSRATGIELRVHTLGHATGGHPANRLVLDATGYDEAPPTSLPTQRLREICRAEGLPEATFYELLGQPGAVCHPATAEVVTQVGPSKFLLLHEIAHLRYRDHGPRHSNLWLRLLQTYMPDEWIDDE